MGLSNTGFATCIHCGAEFRLFTIHNRAMNGFAKSWKQKHERKCKERTPEQRRKWAAPYSGKSSIESSITIDLGHQGFQSAPHRIEDGMKLP